MLVQCTNCSVAYDHARGACIGCGTPYEPSVEDVRNERTAEAIKSMERGARRRDVVARLQAEGELPEREIEAIADAAAEELRGRAKVHGAQVAATGGVLLLGGILILALTGGVVVAVGLLIAGGVTFLLSTLKSFTGWNVAGPDAPLTETQHDH